MSEESTPEEVRPERKKPGPKPKVTVKIRNFRGEPTVPCVWLWDGVTVHAEGDHDKPTTAEITQEQWDSMGEQARECLEIV